MKKEVPQLHPLVLAWEKIGEELRQFSEDHARLDRRFNELVKNHPGSWAAVYKGKIFLARSLEELGERLGKNIGVAAVKRLVAERTDILIGRAA